MTEGPGVGAARVSTPAPVETDPFADYQPVADPFAAIDPFAVRQARSDPFAADPFGGGRGGGGGGGGRPVDPFAGGGPEDDDTGGRPRRRRRIQVWVPRGRTELPLRCSLWGMPAWQYFDLYAEWSRSQFTELPFVGELIDGEDTDELWLDADEAEHCLMVTPLVSHEDVYEGEPPVVNACTAWWDDAVGYATEVWDRLTTTVLLELINLVPVKYLEEALKWAALSLMEVPPLDADDLSGVEEAQQWWHSLLRANEGFRAAFMDVVIWICAPLAMEPFSTGFNDVNEYFLELDILTPWEHLGTLLLENDGDMPEGPHQVFAFGELHSYEPPFDPGDRKFRGYYWLTGTYAVTRVDYVSALDYYTSSMAPFEPGVLGWRTNWFAPVARPPKNW